MEGPRVVRAARRAAHLAVISRLGVISQLGVEIDAPAGHAHLHQARRVQRDAQQLLGISLYTPRLVEVRMPRRRIDLHSELRDHSEARDHSEVRGAARGAYYTRPLHLQQLPCR